MRITTIDVGLALAARNKMRTDPLREQVDQAMHHWQRLLELLDETLPGLSSGRVSGDKAARLIAARLADMTISGGKAKPMARRPA